MCDTIPGMKLQSKKLNILLGGQFGSEGKGLVGSYLGASNHIDIAVTNAAPNAGHTIYWQGRKLITKHLPVAGVMQPRSTIYLCAGAIINPDILFEEMALCDVDPDRVCISPNAAVITPQDVADESVGAAVKISSTQNGVGKALQRKINRSALLAKDCAKLVPMVRDIGLPFLLAQGCTALMEVPQGLGLGINSGFYPHCTSRDISVSQALNDAGLHPKWLGKVIVCTRTYPIRVGNLQDSAGTDVGYSGPFYSDSVETSWEALGLEKEYTTRTNRVRRVAAFSMQQYKDMLQALCPDYLVLNFANYLSLSALKSLLLTLPEVTHLGFGPSPEDVVPVQYFR